MKLSSLFIACALLTSVACSHHKKCCEKDGEATHCSKDKKDCGSCKKDEEKKK